MWSSLARAILMWVTSVFFIASLAWSSDKKSSWRCNHDNLYHLLCTWSGQVNSTARNVSKTPCAAALVPPWPRFSLKQHFPKVKSKRGNRTCLKRKQEVVNKMIIIQIFNCSVFFSMLLQKHVLRLKTVRNNQKQKHKNKLPVRLFEGVQVPETNFYETRKVRGFISFACEPNSCLQ